MDEEEAGGLTATMGGDAPGQLDATSADLARQYLERGLNPGSRRASDMALEQLSKDSEASRRALREARARLISISQPNQQRKMFDLAAALMAPTKSGRTSESIGKAAESLRDTADLEDRKKAAEAQGLLGIDQSLGNIDETLGKARLSLATGREKLESEEARAAMRALKASSTSGNQGIIGRLISSYTPQSIQRLRKQVGDAAWAAGDFSNADWSLLDRAYAPGVTVVNGVATGYTRDGGSVGSTSPLTTPEKEAENRAKIKAAEAAGSTGGEGVATRWLNAPKAKLALRSFTRDIDDIIDEAGDIEKDPGLSSATGLMAYIPSIYGGEAKDAENAIETLKVKLGFRALQDMRANSPTGGALGNITEREGEWLQNAFVALQRSGSTEQYKKNLARIIKRMKSVKEDLIAAYDEEYRSASAPAGINSATGGGGAPAAAPKVDNVKTFDKMPPVKEEGAYLKKNGVREFRAKDGKWVSRDEWRVRFGDKVPFD